MSNQMWMNLDQVRNAASSIGNASIDLRSLLGRLQGAYDSYATDWKGSSKNQFDTGYADLCAKINTLIYMAETLSSGLNTAAFNFASADTGLGTGGNIPGGGGNGQY